MGNKAVLSCNFATVFCTVMPLWVFGEFMDDFLLVSEKKMKSLLSS